LRVKRQSSIYTSLKVHIWIPDSHNRWQISAAVTRKPIPYHIFAHIKAPFPHMDINLK